jgi:hypothetical protein
MYIVDHGLIFILRWLQERYLKKCRDLTLSVKESTALVEENTRLKNVKVQYEEDIYKKVCSCHIVLQKIVYIVFVSFL